MVFQLAAFVRGLYVLVGPSFDTLCLFSDNDEPGDPGIDISRIGAGDHCTPVYIPLVHLHLVKVAPK